MMSSAFKFEDNSQYKRYQPQANQAGNRNFIFADNLVQEPSKVDVSKDWIVTWSPGYRSTEQEIKNELSSVVFNSTAAFYELTSSFDQSSNPLVVFKTPSPNLAIKVLSHLMKDGVHAQAYTTPSDSVKGVSRTIGRKNGSSQMCTNATSSDMFQSPNQTHRQEANESSLSLVKSASNRAGDSATKFQMTDTKRFMLEANHSFANLRFNNEPLVSSESEQTDELVAHIPDTQQLRNFEFPPQHYQQQLYTSHEAAAWGEFQSHTEFSSQFANPNQGKNKKKQVVQQNMSKMTMMMKNSSFNVSKIDKHGQPKFLEMPEAELDEKNRKKKSVGNILYVKGIDKNQVNIKQLVHLFECFGEVEIGMHHTKSEYVLIKFAKSSAAKQCIKELYGKEILGKNLLIHYSEMLDLSMKYYANEKEYYVPNQETRVNYERKLTLLSKHLAIRFARKSTDNQQIQTPKFSVADLHSLFPRGDFVEPFTVTKKNNDMILDFYSVGAAIAFVMENNFKEFSVCVLPDGRYALKNEQNQQSLKQFAALEMHLAVHLSFVSKSKGH